LVFTTFNYHIGPVQVAISGGIAGACFWASVFPTDVVKSRVQVSVLFCSFYMQHIHTLKFAKEFYLSQTTEE
jgi:hypothetical protein